MDTWTFSASEGDAIELRAGDLSNNLVFAPWIRLFDPDGNLIKSSSGNAASQINIESVSLSGAYKVIVSDGIQGGEGTGDYVLSFVRIPGTYAVPDQGGPLTNGGSHPGEITLADIDPWTFSANEGDAIELRAGDLSNNLVFAPFIRLYDPVGNLIKSSSGNAASQISIESTPSSGSYTVTVSDGTQGGSGTGNYVLGFVRIPGTYAVPDQGGPLSMGENLGEITLADIDPWTLIAKAGDTIQLSIEELSGSLVFAPSMRLYDPNGGLIKSSSGNASAQIRATAPVDGQYTVTVSDGTQGGAGTGSYRLNSSHSGGAVAGTPTEVSQKSLDCGSQGQKMTGNPCDIGSGNKLEIVTDYETATPNRLAFMRFYNGLADSSTPAGMLG